MWTAEDFPGADSVPWQLLIRARYAHELDAVVASVVLSRLEHVVADATIERLARAARVGAEVRAGGGGEKAGAESVLSVLRATYDFDDWCGTAWRRPPFPRPRWRDELDDPLAGLVIERALELVTAAGSPALQETLGAELRGFARAGQLVG
jgi:hypothetical protein